MPIVRSGIGSKAQVDVFTARDDRSREDFDDRSLQGYEEWSIPGGGITVSVKRDRFS